MKKLLITMILGLTSLSSFAGYSCHTDAFGIYRCSGTGNDSGYSSNTYRDAFGNDRYSDNSGNRLSCYTDAFGNYRCN